MKFALAKILLIVLFFFTSVPGQTLQDQLIDDTGKNNVLTDDNYNQIDIREMVRQQIETAKSHQVELNYDNSLSDIINIESNTNTNVVTANLSDKGILKILDLRLMIFLAVFFITVLVVLFRRMTSHQENTGNDLQELKAKIAMIRNEEPLFNDDLELSEIRKGLREEPIERITETGDKGNTKFLRKNNLRDNMLNKLNSDISATAKRFNISKGEILLASKIRSFEMDKACSIK